MQKRRSFRRFGLLGYPLGHSLSPFIHERIMQIIGIPGEYKLYALEAAALAEGLPKLLDSLDGFNCTIPYKETIIPYLERIMPSATLYGAVNTVHGRIGYNTDGPAFASCGVPIQGRKVCVLGAGGVARVMTMEAVRARAQEILIVGRNSERATALVRETKNQGYHRISAQSLRDTWQVECDVLLNGTPLGMWPHTGATPLKEGQIRTREAIFDSIYNPTATRLILEAKTRGIWAKGGLQMLFEQALLAQKIWNPEIDFQPFSEEINDVRRTLPQAVLAQSPLKLVLTGFMGSGKSTVGRALAKAFALPFADLDEVIEQRAGKGIADIFADSGEEAFRSLERQVFLEQVQRPEAQVLATGGGTLVEESMIAAVRRANALVICLELPLERVLERLEGDTSRPMLLGGRAEAEALYAMREPIYARLADLKVSAQAEAAQIVQTIMTAFEWEG
jgi:shikimate dehydrogenase